MLISNNDLYLSSKRFFWLNWNNNIHFYEFVESNKKKYDRQNYPSDKFKSLDTASLFKRARFSKSLNGF